MRLSQVLLFAVLTSASLTSGQDNTAVTQLNANLQEYLKIRARAAEGLPKAKQLTNDPKEIEKRQRALAAAVQVERGDAKQGDIFSPDVRKYLGGIIRGEAKGATKEATREGNPKDEGAPVPIGVNKPYPKGAPLSTMPPDLLLKLPQLPKDLQYRFVGETLILFDSLSGLIVDYIPNTM